MKVVAAVDVGGTRVKASLVDEHGQEHRAVTTATPSGMADPGRAAPAVEDVVRRLLADASAALGADLQACGVVVPGLVDETAGIARWSANLGWRDLPLAQPLVELLGVPVAIGHDVRAGLQAESAWGAAQGQDDVLFVPLGTGIAGALKVDGRVLQGGGYAGELGHVQVDPAGPVCGCGARGCLEAVSSAAAIEAAYAVAAGLDQPLAATEVADLVRDGDRVAASVWDHAVSTLARAVVMTVTLTGVDLVLVGGGLAQAGGLLLEPLRRGVRAGLTFQRPVRVEAAALGDRAGCLGAAWLAWDSIGRTPC